MGKLLTFYQTNSSCYKPFHLGWEDPESHWSIDFSSLME